MERLATITEADVKNGVLNRMLADAGIPNVQEYVKHFHEETKELIVEEFEHPDPNKANVDEPIASPADVQSWISGLRLRLDEPIKPPAPAQQPQQPQISTDLKGWAQHMAPIKIQSSDNTASSETAATSTNNPAVTGNLGNWLTDWSKNLTEQPPPASLDQWLKGMIPNDLHEPMSKANTSKGRLNSYLNAAQDVLSQHGYDVSNNVTPPTSVNTKTGMFGNVKQMYFLWKTLDKNNDRKITVEDVQIMLQEMGLGFLSKPVAQTLFDMVDSNHDGELQFRDFIALMGIIKQLIGAVGSTKTK